MNKLRATISELSVHGNLTLVSLDLQSVTFKSIVIETPDTAAYLKKGNSVDVLFKETEVIIVVGDEPDISLRNRLKCTIIEVEQGVLLSRLVLQVTDNLSIASIITTSAVQQLDLTVGKKVWAMIKTNEIMLSK